MKNKKLIYSLLTFLFITIASILIYNYSVQGSNFVYYNNVGCSGAKKPCNSAADCCDKGMSYKKDGDSNCRGCKDEELTKGNFVAFSSVGCSGAKKPCNSAADCCDKGMSYKKDGDSNCRGCK